MCWRPLESWPAHSAAEPLMDLYLAEPPDRSDALARFPTRTLRAGTSIHRIHHHELGPFWFGSAEPEADTGGRFDLATPKGSSYWALQAEAAFLERLARRPITMLPLELLDRFHLSVVQLPEDLTVANSPVKRARAFGLTGEFHTTGYYPITRRWAAALAAAGHRGLLSIPRHDVTAKLRALTLFGRGGEHRPRGWKAQSAPLPSSLLDSMGGWGIRCLPIPFEVDTIQP